LTINRIYFMITFPNCKINIGLHVLSKRADGFHSIETVFLPVKGLKDILELKESRETEFYCTGLGSQYLTKNNLCMKAYELLKESFQLPPVKMHLHKCIPTGAGLGGGSSDAAFTLLLLNKYFQLDISIAKLESYAASLGSDCALFIQNRLMLGKGKGDVLLPIDVADLHNKYIYIIKPNVFVKTPEAYTHIQPCSSHTSLKSLIKNPIALWKDIIINDFEKYVFSVYPQLEELKEMFYSKGALYASMTGSGSAIYGIFNHFPDDVFLSKSHCFHWKGVIE